MNQYLTLSTVVFCLQTMFAAPMSPLVENFTPSLVTEMTTATQQQITNINQHDTQKNSQALEENPITDEQK
jgi:hypothetical protein